MAAGTPARAGADSAGGRGGAYQPANLALLPFQRAFLRAFDRPSTRVGVLSIPRGNGKSTLAAWLALRFLEQASGQTAHLFSSSIGQARRGVFKLLLEFVDADPEAYKVSNNPNEARVTHRASGTQISVLAASHRTAQGLVRVPLIIADEPGAWLPQEGKLAYDVLLTAQGKPDSRLKLLFIGTLAPAEEGNWWQELCLGDDPPRGTVRHIVQGLGDWKALPTLRRANPLIREFPDSWAVLKDARKAALKDKSQVAAFKSYRLNLPSREASEMLLSVEDWEAIRARPIGAKQGPPILGIDLGQNLSWSAAAALWPSGRVAALAVTGGATSIDAQEKRDRVPPGLYQRLVDEGSLIIIPDIHAPTAAAVMEIALRRWGQPMVMVADRFREAELRDAAPGVPLETRMTRWSQPNEDIEATRRLARDLKNLNVEEGSAHMLEAAFAACTVKINEDGFMRLEKRANSERSRDDAAHALVLACGALMRSGMSGSRPRVRLVGRVRRR